MATFATSSAFLCLLLLLASLLTTSSSPDPTVISWATSNPLAMTPQTRNIIDALIGTSDFGSWANVLNGSDSSSLPLSATFFIPTDQALSRSTFQSNIDQSTILYHIVPRGLSLFDLQQFEIGARLPTLLPNNTIVITNNAQSNFSVDDSRIIRPNMLSNGFFTLHGIESVLNYTLYGSPTSTSQQLPSPTSASPSGNEGALASPPAAGVHRSGTPCHSTELMLMVRAIFAVVFLLNL